MLTLRLQVSIRGSYETSRQKKIIDAAFHIFVRDKIESAKMSEIAQAAASEGYTVPPLSEQTGTGDSG